MSNEDNQEAGFLSYMQNTAINSSTPFKAIPDFTQPTEDPVDEEDGFTIVFSKDVAEQLKGTALDLGFANSADFINTAVSVYGQMLGAAKNEGFTQVVLINPETQDMIQVPLVQE